MKNTIRGCFPKINNGVFLTENEEIDDKLYKIFIENIDIKKFKNNKNYFVVKTELRNGFIYGNLLECLTQNFDKNKILMQSQSPIPNIPLIIIKYNI